MFVSILCCAFSVTVSQQHAAQPAPGTFFLTPERIPLDDGSLLEAERGTLFVPMTRSDTSRGVVAIDVWRFRAANPTGAPPVFRLPGGPGFEGLEGNIDVSFVTNVVTPYTRDQDYIVVGQRGIGTSRPNTLCPSRGDGPAAFSRGCRNYWESKGLDVGGFSVIEAAADVADLARAFGYDRIVIRGTSFGSHWGLAVMRYHPELVARALLSGIEGPDHTYDSPTGILNALHRVAASAERAPELEPFIPAGGLINALDSIRVRLLRRPETVIVRDQPITFSAEDVPGLSSGYSGYVGSRRGVATWPSDILTLYLGNFRPLAEQRARRWSRADSGPAVSYSTASEYLLDCSSGITDRRLRKLQDDSAQLLVWQDYSWYENICAPWGVDAGDAFRETVPSHVPVVFVHGDWDFSTPIENALEVAGAFSRGKLITVVGGSHGALGEAMAHDPGFAQAIWRFVRTGQTDSLPASVVLPEIDWVVREDLKPSR